MTPTRILVADSMPIFRAGVRKLLGRESEFEVVDAATLDEALRRVANDPFDLGLIDFDLPPAGGVEAVSRLGSECSAHLVLWSFEPTREMIFAGVRAGASGFLPKEITATGLVRALRGISRGEAPLSRDLASLMIDALHGDEARAQARKRTAVLTRRECEVLALVSQGARNKQIAASLLISEFTVKRHVQNILEKLELRSRRAAAALHATAFDPGRSEPAHERQLA
jgi:DNA-binding NarL/FixJ family response regulator